MFAKKIIYFYITAKGTSLLYALYEMLEKIKVDKCTLNQFFFLKCSDLQSMKYMNITISRL